MADDFEDKYLDVLQNIESAIVGVYRGQRAMTDWEALNAVEALIRHYQAEAKKRNPPAVRLSPLARETFDAVQPLCEWRLGRMPLMDENGQPLNLDGAFKTVDEIIACLKRIRRSIEFWSKKAGRQGYLNYVHGFIA